MEFKHKPVLLKEVIEGLNIKPEGTYVDATAGGGGHSGEILRHLTTGRLIGMDQDPDAINALRERFARCTNVEICRSNFTDIRGVLRSLSIESVDGVLMDLGVSSYQLDNSERGFSYNTEAPLDMRMSKSGISAYDIVNHMDLDELSKLISGYGEERNAYRIAREIVKRRQGKTIETTTQLAQIVKDALPQAVKKKQGHPAKQTFQAIRIAVNDELNALEEGLNEAFESINAGGRLAVISFHSLEDRIVKQTMALFAKGCTCPPDFPVCVCGKKPRAKIINKKPITASKKEVKDNRRSKSAKLRVCQKL